MAKNYQMDTQVFGGICFSLAWLESVDIRQALQDGSGKSQFEIARTPHRISSSSNVSSWWKKRAACSGANLSRNPALGIWSIWWWACNDKPQYMPA
jgi:hypothetical protein